jgi:hypothetical protein
MLIPFTYEVSAGMVGTTMTDVIIVEVSENELKLPKDKLEDLAYERGEIWSIAVDHAEGYGVAQNDYGEFCLDGDEDDTYDPEGYVIGIYNPEDHDSLRCGGGSFLGEYGVREALDNYLTYLK